MPVLMETSDDPRTDFTERMLRHVGTARALAKELADQAKSNNIARRFSDDYQELQIGDLVMLHNPKRTVGLSDKLTRNYFGPYKIIRKFNNGVNAEIEPLDNAATAGKPRREVVHVSRLKRFRQESSEEHPDMEPTRPTDPPPADSAPSSPTGNQLETEEQPAVSPPVPTRRGTRERRRPQWTDDFETSLE